MLWARLLAYVTGIVNQELLLRNEYLAPENRILRGQIRGRLLPPRPPEPFDPDGERSQVVSPFLRLKAADGP